MEARQIEINETVPASRKLQASDSESMLRGASKLIALKGKKINTFTVGKTTTDEAIGATLGPTGNMRAPTLKVGKTVIVGFNEEIFVEVFG